MDSITTESAVPAPRPHAEERTRGIDQIDARTRASVVQRIVRREHLPVAPFSSLI